MKITAREQTLSRRLALSVGVGPGILLCAHICICSAIISGTLHVKGEVQRYVVCNRVRYQDRISRRQDVAPTRACRAWHTCMSCPFRALPCYRALLARAATYYGGMLHCYRCHWPCHCPCNDIMPNPLSLVLQAADNSRLSVLLACTTNLSTSSQQNLYPDY